jgi:eukaryotic-like serine/threonine-protein kinase
MRHASSHLPSLTAEHTYSLGCVMYRSLSEYPPVAGESFQECMYKHVNTIPQHFKDICPEINLPETVEALIEKAMEKDPGKRFQSMLELKEALETLQLTLQPNMTVEHSSNITE